MTDAYETGAIQGFTSPTLPNWQRAYYEEMLLETIRMKSILVPYATPKTDFAAKKSMSMTFSEVYDLEPKWSPTTESTIWFKGGSLDSRTVSLALSIYHDVVKWSDYAEVFTYFSPAFDSIVRTKVAQQIIDVLDIHMRNALLEHPYPSYQGGGATRAALISTDLFDADWAEEVRAHLEDHDVPGIVGTEDGGPAILCITTPRVIHDIRMAAGSGWLDANNYNQTGRKFNAEVGQWAGVRFIKTNRMRLRNAGLASNQSTLDGATVPGQGAKATVDGVYSPGQSGSTRYVPVVASAGFAVGDVVTIHDHSLGVTVLDTDGGQETRRVVAKDTGGANRLEFDKPLLKDHASGNYVTKALDTHASIFLGGPSVVWGVAERPFVYPAPKIDDAMIVNRLGWRGCWKFQQYRPEYYEVVYSAGSSDPISGP
jgi:N4-gp56 family major capsid protein